MVSMIMMGVLATGNGKEKRKKEIRFHVDGGAGCVLRKSSVKVKGYRAYWTSLVKSKACCQVSLSMFLPVMRIAFCNAARPSRKW